MHNTSALHRRRNQIGQRFERPERVCKTAQAFGPAQGEPPSDPDEGALRTLLAPPFVTKRWQKLLLAGKIELKCGIFLTCSQTNSAKNIRSSAVAEASAAICLLRRHRPANRAVLRRPGRAVRKAEQPKPDRTHRRDREGNPAAVLFYKQTSAYF